MEGYKTCTKCGDSKPLTDYHRYKRAKDGRVNICKICARAKSRRWYADNPEQAKNSRRIYYAENLDLARVRMADYHAANRAELNQKSREWYRNNAEHLAAYRQANKEKRREQHRAWYEVNGAESRKRRQQQVRAANRKWANANTEKILAKAHRRRARKAGNGAYLILDKELERLHASPCVACGTTENITADHVIPIDRGGQDSIGNLQPLCGSCNSSKRNKLPIEWRVWREQSARSSVGAA